jgi:hypothetical protein
MPFPGGFVYPCCKADQLIDYQLHYVEMIDTARHSCEYSPMFIIDF